MQLNREYLPASGMARQELVLLHGWGASREAWRPTLAALRGWASVTLLDIPGAAPGCGDEAPALESLLQAVVDATTDQAIYVGWSLGGQLAIEIARRWPKRVAAVVTVCSNPCFQAVDGWPGMPREQLESFSASAAESPAQALRRFDSLQVKGCQNPRQLQRRLQAGRAGEPGAALAAGLDWLARLDLRETCCLLETPQLHLQAADDDLLPSGLPDALGQLLSNTAGAEIVQLANAGHPAPLQVGPEIAAHCHSFLGRMDLLGGSNDALPALEKADVADSFSRAASRYDSVAQLQRDVGTELLGELAQLPGEPDHILDLGSGTGYFYPHLQQRFPGATYTGLDLAAGMVAYAREHHPAADQWLVADAEALPLAPDSVDLVFSSLALQWCYRPELLFAELGRVLRPGGRCVFTSLGPDTLKELRSAWATVDEHQHVNRFLPAADLQRAAERVEGVSLRLRARPFRMEYRQVRELLNELKTLGAHNVNRNRPSGLTGRRALQGMLRAYEEFRQEELLPASYEVYFGILEKS
jgi:malonyl-CoA O-methyltransferase